MSQKIHAEEIIDLYTILETKMKNEKNWLKTVVLNAHNEYIEVSQIEEYVSFALMVGDTLECRIVTSNSIILLDTVVYNIKLVSCSMVLRILNIRKYDNLRKHKRYEVSFSGTFRKIEDLGEKYTVVNNVSLSGMSITTKEQLNKGDKIEVNIKCTSSFITIECVVMWVTQSDNSYSCGLSISYMNDINKAMHRNLIRRLQRKEQRKNQKLEQSAIDSHRGD